MCVCVCRCLSLIMVDVQGGASTPALVRSILQYRDSGPDASAYFAALAQANEAVIGAVFDLCSFQSGLDEHSLDEACNALLGLTAREWPKAQFESIVIETFSKKLTALCDAFSRWNDMFAELGDKAGVGVVPENARRVIGSMCQLPAVVAAGVPGAGGEDALFVLCLKPAQPAVEQQIASLNTALRLCPFLSLSFTPSYD
eukprot:c17940_g1_i1.p1 GENE.c17940_g1_i1~~c17940_g1_i1.p1  ORF type:complete len:200 (+),score=48.08 c17940_g1_i1:97-696(+)